MSVFSSVAASGVSAYPISNTATTSAFATATGDLIVVWVGTSNGSPGTFAVADLAGNTFSSLTQRGAQNANLGQFFYCLSATHANASNTVTLTTQNSGALGFVYVWDVTLSGGTAAYDFDTNFSVLANSPSTSPSYSATGSDEFIVAVGEDPSRSSTYTAGSGFTLDPSVSGSYPHGMGAEHQVTASPGSSAGFSWTGGTQNQIMAVGFKGTASGGSAKPQVVIMGWN